jgi:integrase
VPVHPTLVELGLVARVDRLRGLGEERLFPSLRPGRRGYLSDLPSKFFAKLIDRMLGKDPSLVFHALRHTFISALRSAGVEREVRVALVGHDEQDSIRNAVHDSYGVEAFGRLKSAVNLVGWPGLDLSSVRLAGPAC